jgi:hypothetical protein
MARIVNLARGSASRAAIIAQFDALVERWLAHETVENELLLEAYDEDLGTKD